ncbi:type I glyceraldehyde-3-phosphate dehydrogenase [Candidatus Pacearchaeota archaeon]|nr:MAG: type I glyceraldehyde-3-phosphate dehydrogenase [Candidatus Pacearchaeota archaeon]
MKKVKIGINGFGRVGRQVLRIGLKEDLLDFVAINDLADAKALAHLFKYDSVHGKYKGEISVDGDYLIVDGKKIKVFSERDPSKIDWGGEGVDIVVEATGLFRKGEDAAKHLRDTVKKVVITAPAKGGEDITIVMGVNENKYDPEKHNIISNASCTTNCFAMVVKVLHENFGIKKGVMTTVHAYTNDQRILDMVHRDWRRARAAGLSIIPTTTGAAKAIFKIYPELEGKISAMALRVLVADVSIVDFSCVLEKPATADEINKKFKEMSEGELKRYLGYTEEPLVSIDFVGDSHSAVFDATQTMVVGDLVKVMAWYDNEWGYSARVVDLLKYIGEKL